MFAVCLFVFLAEEAIYWIETSCKPNDSNWRKLGLFIKSFKIGIQKLAMSE